MLQRSGVGKIVGVVVVMANGVLVNTGAAVSISVGTWVVDGSSGIACTQAARPNKIAPAINFLAIISIFKALLPNQNVLKLNVAIILISLCLWKSSLRKLVNGIVLIVSLGICHRIIVAAD